VHKFLLRRALARGAGAQVQVQVLSDSVRGEEASAALEFSEF
jgi:hypothetical protein